MIAEVSSTLVLTVVPLVAGAFGTFMLFVLVGLIGLALTALLDRTLGKEVALLLWAVAVLVMVFLFGPSAPPAPRGRPKPEDKIPAKVASYAPTTPKASPFAPPGEDSRNPFLKHSDTRPLDPVEVEVPPWTDLEIPLPPTIHGPAPAARRLLRGTMPTLAKGDGTTIPPIPPAVFMEAKKAPEDVYDWVVDATKKKTFVYIRAIQQDGTWYDEGKPGFEERKWLLPGKGEGFDNLQVRFAIVSGPEKKLEPADVANARRANVVEARASGSQFAEWHLRRSVENLWHETLRRHSLKPDLGGDPDINALQRAAREMAEVGRTGKEGGEGWRRAARLLRVALEQARKKATPAVRGELLVDLVGAYAALRDEEQGLQAVAEYARTSPTRAEPWLWLGKLHLTGLHLAPEALTYFKEALERDQSQVEARLGEGDALGASGNHFAALASYEKNPGGGYEAAVRRSEALLRLGRVDGALTAADEALRAEPAAARAVVARGAALYAKGDLPQARDAFAQAGSMETPDALGWRAQALYNLGLTCWRMGQADAALAAFEECAKALQYGGSPARFPDETVSPALGRALVAYALGDLDGTRQALQEARTEAPQASYVETFAGVVASRAGDDASAARAFDKALRLGRTYPELDGWLARTQSRLARQAIDAGAPPAEARGAFEAAVAFAARATATEEKSDAKSFSPHLREAWILIHAEHVTPARRRFESARDVVDRVLAKEREQPAALGIRGYCHYRLADYDKCIRDFDDVLRIVPADPNHPFAAWRTYAEQTQADVKKWRSLEEMTVEFDDAQLPKGWETAERAGVTARSEPEEGRLVIRGTASKDGSTVDPTVVVTNKDLFAIESLERIDLSVRIPKTDKDGNAINNVTFGVQVQKSSRAAGTSPSRTSGAGVFYDKGIVAVRAGGGMDVAYKDGEIHRLASNRPWPSNDFLRITVVREDRKEGVIAIYLGDDPEPVFRDKISGFRESRGAAELWIGGFGNQAQPFNVEIGKIRVVRTKKQ